MDFQTAIANYSRGFPGHLKVSRVNFVGELDFTEGLGRSKVQGHRECLSLSFGNDQELAPPHLQEPEAGFKPFGGIQPLHPPPTVSKTANGG